MKTISTISFVLMVIANSSIFVAAQASNGKIVEQIIKREAEYNESSKNPDAADFDRFYVDDYTVTWRVPPRIQTKSENQTRFKVSLEDPNFRRGTIESLTDDNVRVRVYAGSTAIATGRWRRTSKDADGRDTSASGRFTRVWVKQNGRWLLAAAHYSPDIDLEKLKAGKR